MMEGQQPAGSERDAGPGAEEGSPERRWQPLSGRQRRVLGVLVEKAKTTADAYPLTLNALTNGCNQKSNRSPQMNLSGDDVEHALDELRQLGAVAEVQGGGRVSKYRHYVYDWLGVDKVEAAVMAELLLRGEQTLGELRGRAARMEPIADVAALRPIVDGLMAKELMVALTPPGRGQVVTHNLYKPNELEALKTRYAGYTGDTSGAAPSPAGPSSSSPPSPGSPSPGSAAPATGAAAQTNTSLDELRQEISELRALVEQLGQRVGELERQLE